MSPVASVLDGGLLAATVEAEARAAEQLAVRLNKVRSCAETRDPAGLEDALEQSQQASDALARAGTERLRHTAAVARQLGLEAGVTLAAVAARLGSDLQPTIGALRERLRAVAQESAALGICVRFGATSCERLLELHRAVLGVASGYGADGRLGAEMRRLGRHA